MPKTRNGRKSAGAKIIAALSGVTDSLESGIPIGTVRTVELPDEPEEYDAGAVRATRAMLDVSQAVFARLLGVSTILVRSWESGARAPSRLARRLLDEIRREPRRWMALVHRSRYQTANAGPPVRPRQ